MVICTEVGNIVLNLINYYFSYHNLSAIKTGFMLRSMLLKLNRHKNIYLHIAKKKLFYVWYS